MEIKIYLNKERTNWQVLKSKYPIMKPEELVAHILQKHFPTKSWPNENFGYQITN